MRIAIATTLVIVASPATAGDRGRQAADFLLGFVGAGTEPLMPSDIDRRLRDLDDNNPLTITVPETGIRSYDEFFLDLARVEGTLELAEYCVRSSREIVDGALVEEVFSGDIFVDSFGRVIDVPPESRQAMVVALINGDARAASQLVRNFSSIQFRQVRENFLGVYGDATQVVEFAPVLARAVASLPDTVVRLAQAVPELASEAPTAFSGSNVIQAPRVAAALAQAGRDLADLPARVDTIRGELAAMGATVR